MEENGGKWGMEHLDRWRRNVQFKPNHSQTPYQTISFLSNQYGLYPIYPHLSSIKTYKKSPKISKYGRQMF
jgi:hypothetical protein